MTINAAEEEATSAVGLARLEDEPRLPRRRHVPEQVSKNMHRRGDRFEVAHGGRLLVPEPRGDVVLT
jgi:hypothetical protein